MDLTRVAEWARGNRLRLHKDGPQDDATIELAGELVGPRHRGAPLAFAIPAGLRALWQTHGGVRAEQEENDELLGFVVKELWIFSPEELVDLTHRWVRIPADVERGTRRIATDHLVAFAGAGQALCDDVWCFDVADPTGDGEYRIVHSGGDSARYADTGELCIGRSASGTSFVSFDHWLAAYVASACALGREDLHGLR